MRHQLSQDDATQGSAHGRPHNIADAIRFMNAIRSAQTWFHRDFATMNRAAMQHPLTAGIPLAGTQTQGDNRANHNQHAGRRPMSSASLTPTAIDQDFSQATASGAVPGIVAVAANAEDILYEGAFGSRDLGTGAAMTPDSVFWIASMTKAVTCAGAMQIVEQGRLSLDDPIGGILPELADIKVLDGFNAEGKPQLRPARSPITLRQLMTHTAGFCYDMWNGDMARYLEATGTPGIISCRNAALRTPLAKAGKRGHDDREGR